MHLPQSDHAQAAGTGKSGGQAVTARRDLLHPSPDADAAATSDNTRAADGDQNLQESVTMVTEVTYPGIEVIEEAGEEHECVVLAADLRQPPPLPHRQRVIRSIVARACGRSTFSSSKQLTHKKWWSSYYTLP